MPNTNFNQTTNITYISSANNNYAIRSTDDIINVRTSLGATTLYLQNIKGSNFLNNPRTIYINDYDSNAQNAPINIYTTDNDLINSAYQITINTNGGSVAITASNINEWIAVGNGVQAGGVTSVGLQVGTSGSNINVSNSPITSSGNINLNIPNASSTNTGRLTNTDWTTFNNKQAQLVSGTNIKTINGNSILGSGDLTTGAGTVTSIIASSPLTGGTITSSGTIGIPQANGSTNGYLASGDWTTFNNKGNGTVTNVSAITLGTTGTDLTSSVANGTTTPTITLNVPTASATNRGALSSSDWTTFNNKQATLVSGTNIKTINSTTLLGSGNIAVQPTLVSGTNIKTINTNSLLGSGDLTIASAPAWLESNATDLTLWNNGKANISSNTTFGESSLRLNSSGTDNSGFGVSTLASLTTGTDNTAIGYNASNSITTGTFNVSVGSQSLSTLTTGSYNIAIGRSMSVVSSSIQHAIGIGYNAMARGLFDGDIGIGKDALANTFGGVGGNIAIGYESQAMFSTSSGYSISIGYQALNSNDGLRNTAIGYQANAQNGAGWNDNTSLGYKALYNNDDNYNTAIGSNALTNKAGGSNNTAIGYNCLSLIGAASDNSSLGANTHSGGNGCIILGSGASSTGSNQFVVGSVGVPAGTVVAGVNSSTKYWNVIINGVAQKILLA